MKKKITGYTGIIKGTTNDYATITLEDQPYNYFINKDIDKEPLQDITIGYIMDCDVREPKGYAPIITHINSIIETKELPDVPLSKEKVTFSPRPDFKDTKTVSDYQTKEQNKYLKGQSLNIAGWYFAHIKSRDTTKLLEYAKEIYEEAKRVGFSSWD